MRTTASERACAPRGVVSRLSVSMMSMLSSPLQNAVVDRASFVAIGVVVAEAASCFAFGVVAREMLARHELLDASLEMKAELVVELVVGAAARAGSRKTRFTSRRVCAVMHESDDVGVLSPSARARRELLASARAQAIELCFAVFLGVAPFGVEPSLLFHAMERGIERAFFDLELVACGLLDPAEDGETVHRSPGERLEDEQVEGAADEVDF